MEFVNAVIFKQKAEQTIDNFEHLSLKFSYLCAFVTHHQSINICR